MPINPSIPLQVRPTRVQAPDPLQTAGQFLTLRNLGQQGQVLRQRELGLQRDRELAEAKAQRDAKLGEINQAKTQLDVAAKKLDMFGRVAGSIVDEASYRRAIPLIYEGEQAQSYLALPWEEAQGFVQQLQTMGLSAQQQLDEGYRKLEEERKASESAARLPGIEAASTVAQIGAAERTAPGNQAEWADWHAGLPPSLKRRIPAAYSPEAAERVGRMAMTRNEREAAERAAAQAVEAKRHNLASEAATVRGQDLRAEQARRTQQSDAALAGVVMANPELYDELTASAKAAIAGDLATRGFTGFGKKLSDTAIAKMAETKSAVKSLVDLRQVLLDNEEFVGPVSGLAALNPFSPARKAQADIDRVRQRVGRALEGGVLRKEDEEKYKKILATLRDTPDTAIHKIDQLIVTVEGDIATFVDQQRKAGRKVRDDTPQINVTGVEIPKVGGTFQGERVRKVTRIE